MCDPEKPWTDHYQIGKHYVFDISEQEQKELVFELGYPPGSRNDLSICLNRMWGDIVYRSTREIDEQLRKLDLKERSQTIQLEMLKDELRALPDVPLRPVTSENGLQHSLRGQIREVGYSITNAIPMSRARLLTERERLSHFPGGAITNRIEPLRLTWDGPIRELERVRLPNLSYRGKTFTAILSDLEKRSIVELKKINPDREDDWYDHPLINKCTWTVTGNYPSDIEWIRPHDLILPGGSLLDALQAVGNLPYVTMKVATAPQLTFSYTISDDDSQLDWSHSLYEKPFPDAELKNVTLEEVTKCVYDSFPNGYKCLDFGIDSAEVSSFTGKPSAR